MPVMSMSALQQRGARAVGWSAGGDGAMETLDRHVVPLGSTGER